MREPMTTLVAYLRKYGSAATDDEFGGVTYWTDDQLEALLDEIGEYHEIELKQMDSDGLKWSFPIRKHYLVETDFTVDTSTTFTYNPLNGLVTFDSALNTPPTASAMIYNMFQALANLWDIKASHRFEYVNFKSGAQNMSLNQEYEHCINRAQYYRNKIMRRFNIKGSNNVVRG